jgi:hypothetical protein
MRDGAVPVAKSLHMGPERMSLFQALRRGDIGEDLFQTMQVCNGSLRHLVQLLLILRCCCRTHSMLLVRLLLLHFITTQTYI